MKRTSDLDALRRPLTRAVDRAYATLLWGVFALSFCKGFRLPNTWSATHFAFNYSQGFVRRALIGELARRVGGDDVYKYAVFCALSFVVMAAVLFLLARAARRALRQHSGDWTLRVALLVFCASPGVVFLVHLVGYFDYFGLLAVLGLANWSFKPHRRYATFYLFAIGGAVLALIHEGLVVMFAPAALFIAVCQWLRHHEGRAVSLGAWCWLGVHVAAVLAFLAACVIAIGTASGAEHAGALAAFAQRHADFPLRFDAFNVLTTPLRKNVLEVVPGYWAWEGSHPPAISGAIAFVPGFAFLLYAGARELLATKRTRGSRALLLLLFLCASLAPEFMNIVGWDWPRWNSMALMNTVTCLLAYKGNFPNAVPARAALPRLTLGLLLTAIGLASTTMLFDEREVQFFPFDRQVQTIERVLRGGLGNGTR